MIPNNLTGSAPVDSVPPPRGVADTDPEPPVEGADAAKGEEDQSIPSEAGTTALLGPGGGAGSAGPVSTSSFQVSESSGALNVSIPVSVPPGRNGLAPSLTLSYDSYKKNGWVGLGFNLDVGSIQCSTKYGVAYGIYVASINGSTSELVPRSDWGTGYYGAKIEGDFSKYYKNPSTGGWEVTAKDGTKYFYGSTAASRQDFNGGVSVFKYCLDRVEDTNGNYITVSYTKDQGEIYLDRIDYTGGTGLSPSNYVKFYLEDRTDVSLSYTPNYEVRTAFRLKTIYVVANNEPVRAYELTYTQTQSVIGQSRLQKVRQYGDDVAVDDLDGTITSGTALPDTELSWYGENTSPSLYPSLVMNTTYST
jgi:hypothetical protein